MRESGPASGLSSGSPIAPSRLACTREDFGFLRTCLRSSNLQVGRRSTQVKCSMKSSSHLLPHARVIASAPFPLPLCSRWPFQVTEAAKTRSKRTASFLDWLSHPQSDCREQSKAESCCRQLYSPPQALNSLERLTTVRCAKARYVFVRHPSTLRAASRIQPNTVFLEKMIEEIHPLLCRSLEAAKPSD